MWGNKLKKRILKSIVILNVVAMLMLATAATTFAAPGGEKGPPGGDAANFGLAAHAVQNIIAHALVAGTHNAVCNVAGDVAGNAPGNNPATDLKDETPCIPNEGPGILYLPPGA